MSRGHYSTLLYSLFTLLLNENENHSWSGGAGSHATRLEVSFPLADGGEIKLHWSNTRRGHPSVALIPIHLCRIKLMNICTARSARPVERELTNRAKFVVAIMTLEKPRGSVSSKMATVIWVSPFERSKYWDSRTGRSPLSRLGCGLNMPSPTRTE
jgi:hypothetical protein